jgi:hypothetical protein
MTPAAPLLFTVSDLRQRPEFFDIVADRVWRAPWKGIGYPFDYITGRLDENLNAEPIPIALVGHDRAEFLGTASVIASDLEERRNSRRGWRRYGPSRTPARAVSPGRWSDGPRTTASRWGFRAPICARGWLTSFYLRLGWVPIERDVGEHRLTGFIQDVPAEIVRISSPP